MPSLQAFSGLNTVRQCFILGPYSLDANAAEALTYLKGDK